MNEVDAYRLGLIEQGRGYARDVRDSIDYQFIDYYARLTTTEGNLADFLAVFSPDDLEGDTVELAEIACRGHNIYDFSRPKTPTIAANAIEIDAGLMRKTLTSAGIDPLRLTWAPGLTYEEALTLSKATGRKPPEPLPDIEKQYSQVQYRLSKRTDK